MRRFLTRRNIIIAVVLLAIVGVWFWRNQQAKKAAAQQVFATVERKDLQEVLSVTGQVRAEKAATLNYPTSGKLGYINVAVGDQVQAWQALAGLNMGDLQAAERAAYYRYLAADANAKQIEDSVKGHDADETFAQKNARVSAQAARDINYDSWLTSERALRNANLISPFAGVVTAVSANAVGDTVSIVDGVTVVDPSSLYFEILVDETDLAKIKIGDSVVVTLDAFGGRKFTTTLEKIGFVTQISSSGGTVLPVTLAFIPGDLDALRVGLNGDAEIIYGRVDHALAVPSEAIKDNEVTLADGTKVHVQTGISTDTETEIKSGLTAGQKIVVR